MAGTANLMSKVGVVSQRVASGATVSLGAKVPSHPPLSSALQLARGDGSFARGQSKRANAAAHALVTAQSAAQRGVENAAREEAEADALAVIALRELTVAERRRRAQPKDSSMALAFDRAQKKFEKAKRAAATVHETSRLAYRKALTTTYRAMAVLPNIGTHVFKANKSLAVDVFGALERKAEFRWTSGVTGMTYAFPLNGEQ